MRPTALGCLIALLLVCTGCRAETPARSTPTEEAEVTLDAEEDRLQDEAGQMHGLTDVDVRLRSGVTFGRQVIIEAGLDGSADGLTILDELTQAGWHTLAFVPTEVRVTLTATDGAALTPRDLGFSRAGADPAGLYDRYGPPAADESWRP